MLMSQTTVSEIHNTKKVLKNLRELYENIDDRTKIELLLQLLPINTS